MNFRQYSLPCFLAAAAVAILVLVAAAAFRQVASLDRRADTAATTFLLFPSATLPVLHALLAP